MFLFVCLILNEISTHHLYRDNFFLFKYLNICLLLFSANSFVPAYILVVIHVFLPFCSLPRRFNLMTIYQEIWRQANWLRYIFSLYIICFLLEQLHEKCQTVADTFSWSHPPGIKVFTVGMRLLCLQFLLSSMEGFSWANTIMVTTLTQKASDRHSIRMILILADCGSISFFNYFKTLRKLPSGLYVHT